MTDRQRERIAIFEHEIERHRMMVEHYTQCLNDTIAGLTEYIGVMKQQASEE